MGEHPKYQTVRNAIESLHGNVGVDRETTRDALEELRSDIDGMLMAMDEEDRDDND